MTQNEARPVRHLTFCVKTLVSASSETQGQIVGERASPNGRKKMARRKVVLLSPIFLCHKIKDGDNNTNINKPSPAQNTPALQAIINHIYHQKNNKTVLLLFAFFFEALNFFCNPAPYHYNCQSKQKRFSALGDRLCLNDTFFSTTAEQLRFSFNKIALTSVKSNLCRRQSLS